MRLRELFTHGEGISTARIRHKGQQPLIECANHDSNITYFPFYLYFPFLYIFFYVFLAFYVFYFFGVDKGVSLAPMYSSIAMRKSDKGSSLTTEHWLNCFFFFYLFWKIDFNRAKFVFKALDLESYIDFWKERIVKVLDLETISWFFDEMKKFMSWFLFGY